MTACVTGGAGADIDVVVVIIAGALLLELSSFFSLTVLVSIGFDAGSDDAAAGAGVEDNVAWSMDVGIGADIDKVAVLVASALLLLSSFFFLTVFTSIGFDAGSDDAAAGANVRDDVAWGVDVGTGPDSDKVAVLVASALLLLSSFFSLTVFTSIGFDAGSDDAAAGANVRDDVAWGMDVGTGPDIDAVAVKVANVLLLVLSSAVLVSIGFDAGFNDAATGDDDDDDAVGEGMDVGTGADIDKVAALVASVLLLVVPSFFSSAAFEIIDFDADSDDAATGDDEEEAVGEGTDVGADVDINVLVSGVLLLKVSSFFSSAAFEIIDCDAGSDDDAAGANVRVDVAWSMDVGTGADINKVAVLVAKCPIAGALLFLLLGCF